MGTAWFEDPIPGKDPDDQKVALPTEDKEKIQDDNFPETDHELSLKEFVIHGNDSLTPEKTPSQEKAELRKDETSSREGEADERKNRRLVKRRRRRRINTSQGVLLKVHVPTDFTISLIIYCLSKVSSMASGNKRCREQAALSSGRRSGVW